MRSNKKRKVEHISCGLCQSRIHSVFCHLKADDVSELDQFKDIYVFKKDQVIFGEEDPVSGLYCINSGKVKVYTLGKEGRYNIMRLAGKGDVLGYRALLSGESYHASAAALEDSVICFISRNKVFDLIRNNADLSLSLMKKLGNDLKNAEDHITNLIQQPARERLAESLLLLKETYHLKDDEITLNVKLKREDIANMVGATTETVIRLLSDMRSEGIIGFQGKFIQLLDINRLMFEADMTD